MYVLRRIRYPIKTWTRVRRTRVPGEQRLRLRGAERRMANALNQLRQGVPLNWSQVEDDPELETLAIWQSAAQECRGAICEVPPELRSSLVSDLSRRLPEWKPEPAKVVPKSLAGFSEKVPVLTQVEEDVPSLISNVPQWIAATVAGAVVIGFVLAALNNFVIASSAPAQPSFKWIQVREASKTVTRQQDPASYSFPSCQGFNLGDPTTRRRFVRLPDRRQEIEGSVPFKVELLPSVFRSASSETEPISYTTRLNSAAVAPCLDSSPNPTDLGAALKLGYSSFYSAGRGQITLALLTVFQAKGQPAFINVNRGSWKEVRVGDMHGVFRQGGRYRDIEGREWIGDISVLAVERDDGMVITFVGETAQGVTEDMLIGLLEEMARTRGIRP